MVFRDVPVFRILLILALGGCASEPKLPEAGPGAAPHVLVESYKIAVGDQLKVSVWGNEDLSVEAAVRPDGKITVPLVGEIMAVGKEPKVLTAEIRSKLSEYVRNPQVSVILTSLKGQDFLARVRITGAVEEARSVPYSQGMTVLDAVLEAGGLQDYASPNGTKLHRRTKVGVETYDIRLGEIMEDGDMTTNVFLVPGDVITVPERLF
jgi:polysaccharide export outer membrane protein